MLKQLANWSGKVVVNGVEYDSVNDVPTLDFNNTTVITLLPVKSYEKTPVTVVSDKVEHIITVRQYMTKPASPEFDFMDKWNNGIPMPMRTMVGTVEKETKGMVYMKLHGQGLPTVCCVRCGRELTNPISRYYGLGIECIQKVGIQADINEVERIKEALVNITWEGWIIRSSIIEDRIAE